MNNQKKIQYSNVFVHDCILNYRNGEKHILLEISILIIMLTKKMNFIICFIIIYYHDHQSY
jgi:hypothetical protein